MCSLPERFRLIARFALLFVLFPTLSSAAILTKDTVWSGTVTITEDVLVPPGISLTIRPGTRVRAVAAESTKTDPEYVSPLTEITIRGTLRVEGSEREPVEFSGVDAKAGSWAGIVLDHGTALVSHCLIRHADTAFQVLSGSASISDSRIRENRYGVVAYGKSADVRLERGTVSDNEYGVFAYQGARIQQAGVKIAGNRKRDSYAVSVTPPPATTQPVAASEPPVSRRYGDEVFRGDTIWQGRIEIAGVIRVPEGSRLVILPGTIIEFFKRDTTGSGIGENGILIQGRLLAKGTADKPIVFRSAEKIKRPGDWDSINIMNSSAAQNLIEHCRIEHAYRALHFHFSHVGLYRSLLTNNYRGIQFQESLVSIRENRIIENKSGVQGRDSDVTLLDNEISGNGLGANFFRTTLNARSNRIIRNSKEGLRVREGFATVRGNLIDGNRFGMMISDMFYGDYSANGITNNLEIGVSVKNADNIEVSGNFIAANGFNGLNVQESRAVIRNNQISDNGERGIGIQTFAGEISSNNFMQNRLYAIDLEGAQDVAAPGNWWGGDDPGRVIFDKRSDPARGRVIHDNSASAPLKFVWPLASVFTDQLWRGVIAVPRQVTVEQGASLSVAPATVVEFSAGTGMLVKGRLLSRGEKGRMIRFTSDRKQGAGDWDEIQLEYATGSIVSHSVFEYATWGLHSHFTNLTVSDSLFRNNYGGMRFRSGPAEIRSSLFEKNTIGIRSYIGNAVIKDNIIRNNEVGLFVRERGSGLVVSGNNFSGNSSYGIRIGDFNTEDVTAPGNWWGDTVPSEAVFDDTDEPGIGKVLMDPVLVSPAPVQEVVP